MPHFVYAILLIIATVLIHGGFTALSLGWLHGADRHPRTFQRVWIRSSVISAFVLALSIVAYAEALLWAGFYVLVGAFSDLATAHYFSLVTFTTLGYGDITLGEEWRTLAAVQAVNGIMIFGWTTALIVAFLRRLYDPDAPRE